MTGIVRRRALFGAAIGFGGVTAIGTLFVVFAHSVPAAIPALLLLLPVAGAGVVASWRISVPVALLASGFFAIAFVPPIGDMSIAVAEDVAVAVTFVVVAVIVGALKVPGRGAADDALLDDRRALLLRGVSHDLRTPLTTIRSISTELLDGGELYDDGARTQLLGRVVDESDRLDRIVGNLLSVARVQAGALEPHLAPESMAQLAQRSIARLNRDGEHTIVADFDPDIDDVAADSVQVDQVLTNLLENSLRHAPPRSTIHVRGRQIGAHIEVTVSDSGPGFSGAARRHLFEPFRGDGNQSTGLGLTVGKAIVQAHGGTIFVRDEPLGGAHVSFTLPADR